MTKREKLKVLSIQRRPRPRPHALKRGKRPQNQLKTIKIEMVSDGGWQPFSMIFFSFFFFFSYFWKLFSIDVHWRWVEWIGVELSGKSFWSLTSAVNPAQSAAWTTERAAPECCQFPPSGPLSLCGPHWCFNSS